MLPLSIYIFTDMLNRVMESHHIVTLQRDANCCNF